jgi:hypothetical protein
MIQRARAFVVLGVLLGGSALMQGADAPPKAPDPRAVAIADQVMSALGGQDAWRGTHYLRFDFAVAKGGKTVLTRSHTWDKWTGRYRLEGKEKDGTPYLVLMNLGTKDGKAYRKGEELHGVDAEKALKKAYGVWVNDTFWLLMPYKMKDPGVILGYDGEKTQGQDPCDVVSLSFENVGLTPKDRYWVWVDKKTHLVDRWDFVLEGEKPPAESFLWKGWQKYGTIELAPEREALKDGTRIFFPVLDAPGSLPDSTFAMSAAH